MNDMDAKAPGTWAVFVSLMAAVAATVYLLVVPTYASVSKTVTSGPSARETPPVGGSESG